MGIWWKVAMSQVKIGYWRGEFEEFGGEEGVNYTMVYESVEGVMVSDAFW